jgi:putative hydrolase of HD superfamily
MMSLMAFILMSEVEPHLDLLKVLKMVIIHDLVEVIAGDIPVHEHSERQHNKFETEKKALDQLLARLPNATLSDEIRELWSEFEIRESVEAKYAKAMDTLEVVLQHCIADLNTWDNQDFAWALSPVQDGHLNFNPFLRRLKDRVNARTVSKIEAAKAVNRLRKRVARSPGTGPTPTETSRKNLDRTWPASCAQEKRNLSRTNNYHSHRLNGFKNIFAGPIAG